MTCLREQIFFQAKGVSKSFPGVQALSDVDFDLRTGEVHALVGENGAGKSTFCRIMVGLETADGGCMTLNNQDYRPKGKKDAEIRGVRMVLQELNLIANLSIAENIFLGKLPNILGVIDYPRLHHQAAHIMKQVGLENIAPTTPVKSLGTAQQQMVEIAAALSRQCRILILDEPTASLTDKEIELLFAQIKKLKTQAVAVVYISHHMEEVMQISDRITILRDGRKIATRQIHQTGMGEIIHLMVGRDLQAENLRREKTSKEVALRVVRLNQADKVKDVSFDLHRGEILGFAGLVGSGRTETMRALFGADPPDSGQIFLQGSDRPVKIRHPRAAVRHGIAFLTENRKEQGLFLTLPVRVNITLARLFDVSRFGWIRPALEQRIARRYAQALSVRCSSVEQMVAHLSGGNQQKVVIAKWLYRNCEILIFDEPTRGIDVGARFEIYRLLTDLAREGKSLIVVCSDLKELMAICDRIAVMSAGRLVRFFTPPQWSKEAILEAAYSEYLITMNRRRNIP